MLAGKPQCQPRGRSDSALDLLRRAAPAARLAQHEVAVDVLDELEIERAAEGAGLGDVADQDRSTTSAVCAFVFTERMPPSRPKAVV